MLHRLYNAAAAPNHRAGSSPFRHVDRISPLRRDTDSAPFVVDGREVVEAGAFDPTDLKGANGAATELDTSDNHVVHGSAFFEGSRKRTVLATSWLRSQRTGSTL